MARGRTNPGKTVHGSIHDSVQGAVGGMQTGQLDNFPALQDQSNATYDAEQRKLEDPANLADPNRAMEMINVGQSKMSPWAPWFQATANAGAGRFSQDTERPSGLGSEKSWWITGQDPSNPNAATTSAGSVNPNGDYRNIFSRRDASTNIGTPNFYDPTKKLKKALRGIGSGGATFNEDED